jgi:hypothetical protein
MDLPEEKMNQEDLINCVLFVGGITSLVILMIFIFLSA